VLQLTSDVLFTMTSYEESQRNMSRHLSRVLDDIGVIQDMTDLRRQIHLLFETLNTMGYKLLGYNETCYIVGSQSEGTTTIGMDSDTDHMIILNNYLVVFDWAEWEKDKIILLAIKDNTTPPQLYYLQRLRRDLPLKMDHPVMPTDELDEEGRVLVSNKWMEDRLWEAWKHIGPMISHGPSKSFTDNVDMVIAFPCASMPKECKFLFSRPRPGHYPKAETLERVRRCPTFLVPQGHPFSEHKHLQWRISTSLWERFLVFDFTAEQQHVYVLLKIFRKSFIKPVVGDNLSTFHMKTAVMFTIESCQPDIWRRDNIIACAVNCLNTLLRWIRMGKCPHFTTDGVNLFDGKLDKRKLLKLKDVITQIKSHNMWCIYQIQMDMLGFHLLPDIRILDDRRHSNQLRILREILFRIPHDVSFKMSDLMFASRQHNVYEAVHGIIGHLQLLHSIHNSGSSLECEAVSLLLPHMYGSLASTLASCCIASQLPVSQFVINLYQLSFTSDLMSTKLKFASMLYCSGQCAAAAQVLTHCEGLLGPDVHHYCTCYDRPKTGKKQSDAHLEAGLDGNITELLKLHSTLCVRFSIHERCCVPEHLQYEMFRTMTHEDQQLRHIDNTWMDLVVIDCVPFLHYLQYLVYRQLGQPARKMAVLQKLVDYVRQPGGIGGHVDTAAHVLAHCLELENWPDEALHLYQQSVRHFPRNNIGSWHLARLLQ